MFRSTYIYIPTTVLLIALFTRIAPTAQNGTIRITRIEKPEDVLVLEDLAIVQLKAAWNLTHATYALAGTNVTQRIKKFWHALKIELAVINDAMRHFDRKIIESQPSVLLNDLIGLEEIDTLMELSDTTTVDPVTLWKVKWIEVSSLATHIHWLFNKRIRDIMNNVPYIKTIANSLANYFGNPFYPRVSGRINGTHRYAMRNFPRWIDDRMFSVPAGDLFNGLRQLLDACKSCKSGSSVAKDTCSLKDKFGKIVPVRLDVPVFVLFYLCLVDIKFYILKNFFHIYREVYENNPYSNYSLFDDRLQSRIRKKIDSYSASFKDYDGQDKGGQKIMTGYFRCDPPAPNKDLPQRNHVLNESYIMLTNFASTFIIPEKELTPSGNCRNTCQDMGRADSNTCYKPDAECWADAYPECASNPELCENFKPICPLQDTFCFRSGMSAVVCPSKKPGKLFEWVKFNNNDNEMIPLKSNVTCEEPTTSYEGGVEPDPQTKMDQKCEICTCQCLEPLVTQGKNDSVRYFSQKESLALLEENRVAVGFKFEQIEDQIHIAVADAVSLPGYKFDRSTLTWRRPTLADLGNPQEVARVGRALRAFHMDSSRAPESTVVTGIRFAAKSHGLLGTPEYQPYISANIRVTKVDPITGKLDPAQSQWLSNSLAGMKAAYKYLSPDDPVLTDGPSLPDSGANQLVFFRTTHVNKTTANLVIPFFDAQEIVQERGSALKGVGVFHKRRVGYGGFLGIKILPYSERL